MKVRWKKADGRYRSGFDAFVGPYVVGCVFWDVSRQRDDPHVWATSLHLPAKPGYSWSKKNFRTHEEAQEYIDRLIERWFDNATVEPAKAA